MNRNFGSPAELVPDTMAKPFRTGQSQKNLPRQMDQVRRNSPPPVTGQEPREGVSQYDRGTHKGSEYVPGAEALGPPIIPQPREKSRKRERPGLTKGMQVRLLSMITRARSESAASRAHLDRMHELRMDLVNAKSRAQQLSNEFERTQWARAQDGGRSRERTEAQKAVARELDRVKSLNAEIDRLDQITKEHTRRSWQLRTMVNAIGRRFAVQQGRVRFGEIDEADIDFIEENLIGN
jgi:hypothetical protein